MLFVSIFILLLDPFLICCHSLACTKSFRLPHLISLSFCECACVRERCFFTTSFLGCVAHQTNPHRQDLGSPTERGFIRICCTNWRTLTAEGATRPPLPGTRVPCCGLTLEFWALSNHIWLIRLPVLGLVTSELVSLGPEW